MKYDLIVVGAGPAGSTAADTVARAGYDVLVLERDPVCKSPCAGYISSTINVEFPGNSALQKIIRMRTYLPDLSFHDFPLNGFVVDRSLFDMGMASRAADAGARFIWKSPLMDITPAGVKFRGGEAYGKIIVGADGVFSKTAALLGEERQRIAVCAQYHLTGIEPILNTSEIIFDADYAPGGYVWIYPTGVDSAKVGLGVTLQAASKSPHQYLDAFIQESRFSHRLKGQSTEYITGALPIGGLREKLCYGNILLAGDSAGMADPITGAGINSAILAGQMAGSTIISALELDDITILKQYGTKINRLLARPLKRSVEKRQKLDECCTSNRLLQERLPGLWVTFRQYWV